MQRPAPRVPPAWFLSLLLPLFAGACGGYSNDPAPPQPLPPEVTTSLFSEIADAATASRGPEAARDVKMTPREQEVIDCIARGLSNQKIADELTISVHTVKSHVRNIMEKLALHSRLQIAAWAHDERE